MKKYIALLILSLTLIIVFSCKRDYDTAPIDTYENVESFSSLIVPDDFNYKTSREIDLNIRVLDELTSLIEIYNGDPDNGGALLKKGLTGDDHSFHTTLILANTLDEIYVVRRSFDGSVRTESIPVISGSVNYNFGYKNLKSASTTGNMVDNGDFEDIYYSYLDEINLQSNISSSNLDNWILKTYQNNKPNADTIIEPNSTPINHVIQLYDNKTNKDAFAYYYVEADPNTSYTLSVAGIIIADEGGDNPYISLQYMGANGQIIEDYYEEYDATTWTTKTITETSPTGTVYIKVVLATTIGGEGEVYFDDVSLTGGTPTLLDTDGDLIPDALDDYPNDVLRAFNSYYPNATEFSSYAFEDLWPYKGDYDFNDLIINFKYQTVTNASNQIVDLICNYKIMAAGASFNNGFGISLDALPANVSSVIGTQILGSGVTLASNGLEAGHVNKSVVIVCDQINTYTGSGMLNTEPTGPTIDVPMITVTVTFGTPQASIGTEPYNSFIYVNQARGREVHLINQPPTELADASWFGQGEDVSSASNSEYYKTVENYPFGLETPVPLDYPTEKQDIVTAHLKFGNWAQSSGSQFPDWYDNKPGYRNNNKVKHNNGTSISN
ncbi:MAG: LruC domain-containing protein [Bacteroidales bacterium]|nr:LruC domain-containing protein [Bacteroidales bacterium]MCF8456861.1 LruC domain-containing protein [Bacteroidales bacterium]